MAEEHRIYMKKVVILSTADFDSAVWTNKQHLAVGLAENHKVVYIESLGLREPGFSKADLSRAAKKAIAFVSGGRSLSAGTGGDTRVPENMEVVSPMVVPFHKHGLVRSLNRVLLKRQLRAHIGPDADAALLWTFSPLTYGLESAFRSVVYHSVDLLHTFPGIPSQTLLTTEKQLIDRADHVIASSTGVKEHLETIGCHNIMLWENVAHVKMFMEASANQRKDQAVFAGNLTLSKLDMQCFISILDSGLKLALAGPIEIDGTGDSSELTELINHPHVTYYGNLALPDLAKLLGESKVGLIPYQVNSYTQGVFPMKVYEYLAAGLSVVSTALPSLSSAIHNVSIVPAEDFGRQTFSRVAAHNAVVAGQSFETAKGHSWDSRILQATDLIDTSLDRTGPARSG
ncbi:glycosyltransferase [Arthrobacter sp. zg-Y769]|uniref:glycosyltransferase n=1 Tax=Arthrobacter sp. zg-Y769 TaxID=2894191 RepID=UPI001E40CDB9|nr:glycosyltransferase [Arthrobacter sp. zg-Y769]MCC9205434.1 glycosyltransferase [Arthrobacter sp. zg-Y769]